MKVEVPTGKWNNEIARDDTKGTPTERGADMVKTVLYAEDEFTNRKIVEMVCRKLNINCILAEDGLQALEMFRNQKPDLVILDQYMPGYNGDIVAEKIRMEDDSIPLIAITSDDEAVTRLESSGFNRVLVKPVKNRDYETLLNTYLES